MKLSETIAPNLPYLRRYARALTGTQKSGDAYISALLESVIADPTSMTAAANIRVALYQVLSKIWGSFSVNDAPQNEHQGAEKTVDDRLGRIPALPRQVYLLNALEGFSFNEISDILARPAVEVSALYDQAVAQIASMISSDVLIIEDEPLIAIDIEDLVKAMGHRVIGIARTRSEAVEIAAKRPPQLVLSDIQLADGSSGIDAVNDLLKTISIPVIFITAFPERLLTGERPEPAFLITKPFAPDMVKGVIAQAIFFDMASRRT